MEPVVYTIRRGVHARAHALAEANRALRSPRLARPASRRVKFTAVFFWFLQRFLTAAAQGQLVTQMMGQMGALGGVQCSVTARVQAKLEFQDHG
jgi:hypothetical protein